MKNITVIGSGALGTALSNVLVDANKENKVIIYGIDEGEIQDLKNGHNKKYFGDLKFNCFNTTNNLEEALNNTNYIVIALPSVVIDKVLDNVLETLNSEVIIINGSKGFYPSTETPLHTGIVEKTKNNKFVKGVVSILGPSFAIEIINKALTSIAAIGSDNEQLIEIQNLFKTSYFKLYRQSDVIGAEVGGIYKNILAIGAGMLTELGYKINTLASYLTRGMKEMSVFNKFMGGKEKTIYGLTGLGDLILTATDDNSRNYSFGKRFVKGDKETKNITIEGLTALNIVEKIRKKNNLYLPIVKALYEVIYEGVSFDKIISNLWMSESKSED